MNSTKIKRHFWNPNGIAGFCKNKYWLLFYFTISCHSHSNHSYCNKQCNWDSETFIQSTLLSSMVDRIIALQRYLHANPWNLWVCNLQCQMGACRCDWRYCAGKIILDYPPKPKKRERSWIQIRRCDNRPGVGRKAPKVRDRGSV